MSTTSRLAVSAAVLGGGLLLAGPASAQEACAYPFDCPPVSGGSGQPATGGSVGTPTVSTPTVVSNAGGGGPASLPFTGGEVTMLALAGAAALAGGAALVAAGRKRSTV